jgi:hypothetical protein
MTYVCDSIPHYARPACAEPDTQDWRRTVRYGWNLNMNLGGKHFYGTKRGRDLLREGLRQSGLVCVTSHERIPPGELERPLIDHICLPEAWAQRSKVVEAWPGTVGGVRLSDHSAVVVEVAK